MDTPIDFDFEPLADSENIAIAQQGKYIYLRIDGQQPGVTSGSGKSKVIACTRGAKSVGGVAFNINIYRPIKK